MLLVHEVDIAFRLLGFCVLCRSMLDTTEGPLDELKRCPLGHGIYYIEPVMDDCEHIHVVFEPDPLVAAPEKSPLADAGVLFRSSSNCVFCGDHLEKSLDLPEELRVCPLGHGAMYVYDQGDDYHVVGFEAYFML